MKMPLSSLWSEFKAFAFKGNMIDLAVAVVIGAAFSGVIGSLVHDIIMPSVIYVTTAASHATKVAADVAQEAGAKVGLATRPSATQASTQPSSQPSSQPTVAAAPAVAAAPPPPAAPPVAPAAAPAEPEKVVNLTWRIGPIEIGHFVGELLNFLIVAFAVFLIMVKLLGSVMKKVGGTPAPSEPTTKECPECLSVIPLKATRCAYCTAKLAEGT